jgi:hypothetical protein
MDPAAPTPTISEFVRSYPFRICLYAIATLAIFETVYLGIRTYGAETMGPENGPIEVAQTILAVIGALGLFYAAAIAPIGRSGFVLCGAVIAYAAARESDLWFETLLFDDAYKWLVGLPMLIVAGSVVVMERRRIVHDVLWLMDHPAATLFVVAGVFLCFVCQVLDRPAMWVGLSDEGEMVTMKALIEEFCELFAYLLLALSGLEAALFARRIRSIAHQSTSQDETVEIYHIAA